MKLIMKRGFVFFISICMTLVSFGCASKGNVETMSEVSSEAVESITESMTEVINGELLEGESSQELNEDAWEQVWKEYAIGEGSGIYKITDLVNKQGYEYITYAVMPGNRLMILSIDTKKKEIVVDEMNLMTKDSNEVFRTKYIEGESGKFDRKKIEILSPDPIVIYDRSANVKYYIRKEFPSGEETFCGEGVSENARSEEVFSMDGNLCANNEGVIELIREKENGLLLELPEKFILTRKNEIVNGKTLFSVTDAFDDFEGKEVYLELKSGGLTYDTFSYSKDVDLDYRVEKWGVKIDTNNEKVIRIYDFLEEKLRVCDNESIKSILIANELEISRYSIYDNLFVFSDAGNDVYLINAEEIDPEEWTAPEREYVVLDIMEVDEQKDIASLAEEIMNKYDVVIRYGIDVREQSINYSFTHIGYENLIRKSLYKLDFALSLYPNGFFKEMDEKYNYKVEFNFVSVMKDLDCSKHLAAGLTLENIVYLAIGGGVPLSYHTVVHELTHVIDNIMRNNTVYDEMQWNALNAEGFSYLNMYFNESGETYEELVDTDGCCIDDFSYDEDELKNCFFVSKYSKTFPWEDRATVMSTVVCSEKEDKRIMNSKVYAKAVFLAEMIRETFDDSAWETPPIWEEKLGIDLK